MTSGFTASILKLIFRCWWCRRIRLCFLL